MTTSLKAPTDHTPQLLLPGQFNFNNFALAINKGGIFTAIINSIIVTASAAALASVLSALAAYPLARRSTNWNRAVYGTVVSLIMVPPLSILVPLYSFLVQIGATNTLWGEILIMTTMQVPLAVFLYAEFIRSVPIALDEAAALDGAGPARTFFMIIFPILKPVTATVLILSGVAVWNEFALSSYLLTEPKVRTIAPAVASFFAAQGSNIGAAAAAALLAAIPVVVAYLFLQRYFIKGMLAGAEK
ncbi:carbohydrate ABC transporter permease [Paenarthrobacter sp. NPDC092416]|uniref:carbohydrate ABC transporter permease n=1 Tax=Paenarthrobacter sp. NPDC092416 TaxID=3364386 RepID=UPI00381BFA07